VRIDLGAQFSIARVSPPEQTAEQFITLAVRPNLASSCTWQGSPNETAQAFTTFVNDTHSVALGLLAERTYQYLVECTGAVSRASTVIGFIVNRQPPGIEGLSGPAMACSGTSVTYTFNVTGLDQYPIVSYSLGTGTQLALGNTTSHSFTISLAGVGTGTYTVGAAPYGGTGLAGQRVTTNLQVLANDSQACAAAAGRCGDGAIGVGEACDGTNLAGLTCGALGFSGGTLRCSSGCALDTSLCSGGGPAPPAGTCGDRAISRNESCDSTNLSGLACSDFGFEGGALACTSCRLNTSSCTASASGSACSNGVRDSGEEGIDCGGVCSGACIRCLFDTECPSTMSCESGICVKLPTITPTPAPPENPNGNEPAPPLGGPSKECASDFQCAVDEECSDDGVCVPLSSTTPTDPQDPAIVTPEDAGTDWLALVFIILGLVVMGGSGYYLYEQRAGGGGAGFASKSMPSYDRDFGGMTSGPAGQAPGAPQLPPAQQARKPPAPPPSAQEQQSQNEMRREQALEDIRERKSQRTQQRHDAFSAFEKAKPGAKGAQGQQNQAQAPKAQQQDDEKAAKKQEKKPKTDDDVFDKLDKL
jgi:hypothetical protein